MKVTITLAQALRRASHNHIQMKHGVSMQKCEGDLIQNSRASRDPGFMRAGAGEAWNISSLTTGMVLSQFKAY
jgi:hypothetical protein